MAPGPLWPQAFLRRINTSGVKIRHILKKYILFSQSRKIDIGKADVAKIIIVVNYFRKTLHPRCLTRF